jgi:hypothetical protein
MVAAKDLRFQASVSTICGALFRNSAVLLIDRSDGGTVGSMVGRILDSFRAGYVPPGKTSSISSEEVAIIDQVLSPIALTAVSSDITPICWPSSVFLYGDRPNERAPLVADVTGVARIIFYGPYFHLPAGRWQVQVVLGFSDDIFGTPFSIEVHGSAVVAKAVVKPHGGGIFTGSFSMAHTKSQDPLELRIRNEEGAIEGRIGLARVRFLPKLTK